MIFKGHFTTLVRKLIAKQRSLAAFSLAFSFAALKLLEVSPSPLPFLHLLLQFFLENAKCFEEGLVTNNKHYEETAHKGMRVPGGGFCWGSFTGWFLQELEPALLYSRVNQMLQVVDSDHPDLSPAAWMLMGQHLLQSNSLACTLVLSTGLV